MPAESWVISPSVSLGWRETRLELSIADTGAAFSSADQAIVDVLRAFARPTTIEDAVLRLPAELPAADVQRCIATLIEAGAVVPAGDGSARPGADWDRTALAYHRALRSLGEAALAAGGAPMAWGEQLALPLPDLSSRPFVDILESRSSERLWGRGPIALSTLSALLYLAAGERRRPDGSTRRSYGSGGALYSLDCYLTLAPGTVPELDASFFRYLPQAHGLQPVATAASDIHELLAACGRSCGVGPVPAAITITSRIAQPAAEYGRLAYSLVLKEAGALLHNFALAAAYCDIGLCPLGGGTPDALFARLSGTHPLAQPIIAELAFGPRQGQAFA